MKKQKRYDKEFKFNAVKLFKESGEKIGIIEEDLGIGRGNLRRWINEVEAQNELSFPGKGNISKQNEEILKLKRENRILKEERDILKKVVSIFS